MQPRLAVVLVSILCTACASLDGFRAFIQPPRFSQADDRPSEIQLTGPTVSAPSGGATIRLWTTVSNPNRFGVTLGTLRATLHLESSPAATIDFPMGLPLQPEGQADVPIDLFVSFQDIPGLSQAITRVVSRQPIAYELEGTIGVSAGAFGEPVFGPMTLLRGTLR